MKKTIIALVLLVVLSIGATAQDAVLSSITEINKTMAEINNNITSMKTDIAVINTRLNTIEGALEKQSNRMDVMDSKVDGVDNTVTQIQTIQATNEKWLKLYGPVFVSILATILGYLVRAVTKNPKETTSDNPKKTTLKNEFEKIFQKIPKPEVKATEFAHLSIMSQLVGSGPKTYEIKTYELKEEDAIQSSSEPEPPGLRPEQRPQTRPAT